MKSREVLKETVNAFDDLEVSNASRYPILPVSHS
jgi:hypothetical protein